MTDNAAEIASFVPENDLEAAMLAAALDPTRYADFMAALRAADVFVPSRDSGGDDRTDAAPTVTLPLIDWEGRQAVPVFSSLRRMAEAVDEVPSAMAFHFLDLAGVWQDQWMLLNPGSALGLPLSPAQVRDPAAEQPPSADDTEISVGEPAVEDDPLMRRLVVACRDSGRVLAAYRAQVLGGAAGRRPRLVVGLLIETGADSRAVLDAVRGSLERAGASRPDLALIDASDSGPVSGYMVRTDRPFFRR